MGRGWRIHRPSFESGYKELKKNSSSIKIYGKMTFWSKFIKYISPNFSHENLRVDNNSITKRNARHIFEICTIYQKAGKIIFANKKDWYPSSYKSTYWFETRVFFKHDIAINLTVMSAMQNVKKKNIRICWLVPCCRLSTAM